MKNNHPSDNDLTITNEEYERYIGDFLLKEENKYLIKCINAKPNNADIINQKKEELKKLSKKIQSDSYIIKDDDYESMKKFAISPGGFLSSSYRILFYKKIYCITESNKNKFIYITPNKDSEITDPFNLKFFEGKVEYKVDGSNSLFKHIINVDSIRSKISTIIKNQETPNNKHLTKKITHEVKKRLEEFLLKLTSLNQNIYSYFQGYHDICLFFLILFYKEKDYALTILQHFSEFNLKENLENGSTREEKRPKDKEIITKNDEIKKENCSALEKKNLKDKDTPTKDNENFDIVNCLLILKEVIKLIDPNVQNFLNEIMRNGLPFFAISWIITYFTYDIEDTGLVYRLLDYFIVSHPIAIYHMSAWIIIENIYKIINDSDNDECKLFMFFNNNKEIFDLNNLDFDDLINKTENSMRKHSVNKLKQIFKEIHMKDVYPLANEETYIYKWIMNNDKDLTIIDYFKGQLNILKKIFGIK